MLWHDPGAVEQQDWAAGAGGAEGKPKTPFRFVKEDLLGSKAKVVVQDGNARVWDVKFGSEVHSETFASRLPWAMGYFVEPTHFVAAGTVAGIQKLKRHTPDLDEATGNFRNARFQLRDPAMKYSNQYNWAWDNNPFRGSHEMNGLKILVMLVSDWDDKDERNLEQGPNTAVFQTTVDGESEFIYAVVDWGGSMGRWGHFPRVTNWDCQGYVSQTPEFLMLAAGKPAWGYIGRHYVTFERDITFEDIRWLMHYLGRVTDAQIAAGLAGAGATPAEVSGFGSALRARINQLAGAATLAH